MEAWALNPVSSGPQRDAGVSQLLLACLDAGIGFMVQGNIAALPGIQIEEWVFHKSGVKAFLPQLCLLELEGP